MHGSRLDTFTHRYVGKREVLYNPEASDWPVDEDRDANWDWLILICLTFGCVIAGIGILIIASALFL